MLDKRTAHPVQFGFRQWTAPLRTLPDFLIIGAQKSGTTTLYKYLIQHPAVRKCFMQEVHYFDLNFHRGRNWYRAHFPSIIGRFGYKAGSKFLTGEVSAYYLFHPQVPRRVLGTVPNVRILVVLRDPVERAWAHYQQNVNARFEHLDFEEAIEREGERLAGEHLRLSKDGAAVSFNHREYSYLARGRYLEQIRPWLEGFPRDRILILDAERLLFKDPAVVLGSVYNLLELNSYIPQKMQIFPRRTGQDMKAATRKSLREYFRPHNERLFEFLGRDFDWKD